MYGPAVRCKRNLELAVLGLASMYQASDWSTFWLRATMDSSAHWISLADRPVAAIWVTSFRMRREDRSSISSIHLADLAGKLFNLSRGGLSSLTLAELRKAITSGRAQADDQAA